MGDGLGIFSGARFRSDLTEWFNLLDERYEAHATAAEAQGFLVREVGLRAKDAVVIAAAWKRTASTIEAA